MNDSIQTISLFNLTLAFIPALVVIGVLLKWSLEAKTALYAIGRMLAQLLLIGYFLTYIFETDSAWIVLSVLAVMVCSASWIALRSVEARTPSLYKNAFIAIGIGGGTTLLCVTQGVLQLQPWYLPQYMIPLAGMIFSNSMNSVSLAAERFYAEIERNVPYDEARRAALHTSLIPLVNSLFAVGLVSLPGMMTGQILSGVSPFIAARYQIMVMCMVFGSAGISTACFLILAKSSFTAKTIDHIHAAEEYVNAL